jgi:hypothetical protein
LSSKVAEAWGSGEPAKDVEWSDIVFKQL